MWWCMHKNLNSAGRVTRNPAFHVNYPDEEELFSERGSAVYTPPLKPSSEYIQDRPNLLDKATINRLTLRLRMLLILGASSGAFPWYWNRKENRIDKWRPWLEKLWKVQWFIVTIQTACLTVFQIYSFIHRVSGQNITYREVFMNFLSVYWYICAVYFNINMLIFKDQVRDECLLLVFYFLM